MKVLQPSGWRSLRGARPPMHGMCAARVRQAQPGRAMHLRCRPDRGRTGRGSRPATRSEARPPPCPRPCTTRMSARQLRQTCTRSASSPPSRRTGPPRRAASGAAEPMRCGNPAYARQRRNAHFLGAARHGPAVPAPADTSRPRPKEGRPTRNGRGKVTANCRATSKLRRILGSTNAEQRLDP